MGDGRSADTALRAPGAAVKDTCQGSQEHIAPVEAAGPFIEVSETEEARGEKQGAVSAEVLLEEVLEPTAKEKFFGNGDEEEGKNPGQGSARGRRPAGMEMKKSERKAEGESDWNVEGAFAQTDGDITQAKAQVEAGSFELPDENEAINAGIEKQDLVEDCEVWRPGALEPAQVDGDAEEGKNQKLTPVASGSSIDGARVVKENRYCNGKHKVEREP